MREFQEQPNRVLCELSVFERLMPTYKDELWEISKFIRNKVWDKIDDERLSILLSLLNTVYQVAVDVMGENFEILLQYIQVFVRKLKEYMGINVETEAYELLQKMLQQKIQDTIKMQWAQLNPNMVEDSEKYEKNLLQILDDFWANISSDTKKEFLYPLKNYKSLIRGRKGIWDKAENLSAPSIEVATKNGILNRWNPPEKRYLYLVDATNISLEIAEQTCFEEMRITNAETKVTIGNFQVIPKEKNNKILNLDYERTTLKDIFQRLEVAKKKETDLIICDLKRDNIRNKEKIKSYVRAHRAETEIVVQIFAADFLLKQISSTIFVPLDSEEDTDAKLKEQCYKSFHIFAEWCEKKNIGGIRYPSTRMALIGKKGTNIVLFDADAAIADESSFRVRRMK